MGEQRTRSARNAAAIGKGAIAGLTGGLVASWVMNEFQAGWSKASSVVSEGEIGGSEREHSEPERAVEDATMKAAAAIFRSVIGRDLTHDEKAAAGPVVHYAFGGAMGAVYGALVEATPAVRVGRGLPFGTALWFGADELAIPAVRLSGSPLDFPVSVHASALASHLVYGFTLDLVRRAVRALW
jgi:putative membrane protein